MQFYGLEENHLVLNGYTNSKSKNYIIAIFGKWELQFGNSFFIIHIIRHYICKILITKKPVRNKGKKEIMQIICLAN
ncbi:hypothetical protein SOLI23_08125 [Solibacillus silvestris]|nr:hypothetical protein SOLI23_08125 [Solibacillus silvestris]